MICVYIYIYIQLYVPNDLSRRRGCRTRATSIERLVGEPGKSRQPQITRRAILPHRFMPPLCGPVLLLAKVLGAVHAGVSGCKRGFPARLPSA